MLCKARKMHFFSYFIKSKSVLKIKASQNCSLYYETQSCLRAQIKFLRKYLEYVKVVYLTLSSYDIKPFWYVLNRYLCSNMYLNSCIKTF